MAAQFIESIDDMIDDLIHDKDKWPEAQAPGVWSGLAPQRWAEHALAFESKGSGGSNRLPTVTVLSDLDPR